MQQVQCSKHLPVSGNVIQPLLLILRQGAHFWECHPLRLGRPLLDWRVQLLGESEAWRLKVLIRQLFGYFDFAYLPHWYIT